MLFDSHTHINNDGFSAEQRKMFIRDIEDSVSKKDGLSYVMDVGFDLESSNLAVKHSEKYPWCYAVVGCHPHDADKMDDMQLAMFKGLLKKEKVKAMGEIGLDFHYDNSKRDAQEYWFREQIRLANKMKMPIVIHSRDADQKTMDILKEEGAFSEERKSFFPKRPDENGEMVGDARVLLHCFSGNQEIGKQYVKLGATLSIAGPVTYKNSKKLVDVVKNIPIEYLLVETDAPYLTPEPMRGKKNRSSYVEHTAKKVADIKGLEFEYIANKTCENGKRFFNIS